MIETIARPWRGSMPLNPRTALSDLIARVFSAPFAKVFSSPIASPGAAAAAVSWWLSGGIAAANCTLAFDAKNATSFATSLANLANAAAPISNVTTPTWAAGTGWTGNGTNMCLNSNQHLLIAGSMIVRYANATSSSVTECCLGIGYAELWTCWSAIAYRGISVHSTSISTSAITAAGTLAGAGNRTFFDGVFKDAKPQNGGNETDNLYILAENAGWGVRFYSLSTVVAGAVYNITLSDAQISAIHTAIMLL